MQFRLEANRPMKIKQLGRRDIKRDGLTGLEQPQNPAIVDHRVIPDCEGVFMSEADEEVGSGGRLELRRPIRKVHNDGVPLRLSHW